MAIRELKLPILKHSRATSMKNSMTRALCFFFPGCMVKKRKGMFTMQVVNTRTQYQHRKKGVGLIC